MKLFHIALALVGGASIAVAQGTDTCTSPTVIAGAGPWAFDNTSATTGTQGQTEGICTQYGSTVLKLDVWFTWNATFSGHAVVNTCGTTGVDTKVAVYPGTTCPTAGTALACNDDACTGFQSTTNAFPVTMGQNYVIQIGVYPVGTVPGGTGMFDIQNVVPPTNDNCATPLAIAGPGQYAFDNSYASRDLAFGQNEVVCLIGTGVSPNYRDLWYTYTAQSSSVRVSTCDLVNVNSNFTDTRITVYPGTSCPAANTAIACEDDGAACVIQPLTTDLTFTAVCGTTYLIQLSNYNPNASVFGMLEFTEVGAICDTPSVPFCLGDGTGAACPCGNTGAAGHGCGSSAFAGGAILSSSGIASDETTGTDTLVLTATDIPGPGLFFQSNGLAPTPIPFGDGLFCATVGIMRLGVVFPTSGVASYPGGLTPNEIHIAGAASAGQTKHYQCWYRSVPGLCSANNYNLTQGLTLVWGP